VHRSGDTLCLGHFPALDEEVLGERLTRVLRAIQFADGEELVDGVLGLAERYMEPLDRAGVDELGGST
jgi:hypothetical protein